MNEVVRVLSLIVVFVAVMSFVLIAGVGFITVRNTNNITHRLEQGQIERTKQFNEVVANQNIIIANQKALCAATPRCVLP